MAEPARPHEQQRRAMAMEVARSQFVTWTPWVLARPWRGDTLLDRRHVWDTTALTEPGTPTRVMFSLDVGHHASGWFANSDFEQCLHLSISHPVIENGQLRGRVEDPSIDEVRAWGVAAFGEERRLALVEPPASPLSIDVLQERRSPHVAHIRLWLDRNDEPVKPSGEVYDLKPWDDGSSPEKIFRR